MICWCKTHVFAKGSTGTTQQKIKKESFGEKNATQGDICNFPNLFIGQYGLRGVTLFHGMNQDIS